MRSGDLGSPFTYNLSVQNYSTPYVLSSMFYGVDIRADSPFNASDAAYLNETNALTWRYPGGDLGEKTNYTTNEEEPSGGPFQNNITNFVTRCREVACHAILQLPAEIDSPPTDAYYVAYIETTLQFTPAIWEIGNDPALYGNFTLPWADWGPSNNDTATPPTYAAILPAIIAAIRAVDPTTPISPFGNVGTGPYQLPAWTAAVFTVIQDTAQYIDTHSYPVQPTNTTQGFYQSLYTSGGPYANYSKVIAALLSVCPSCTNVKLLITELGTARKGVNTEDFADAFPADMFDMASLIQTTNPSLLIRSDDFFSFTTWVSGSGPSPPYYAFKDITPYLGSTAMEVNVSGGADGNELQVGAFWSAPNNWSLLIVNLDCVHAVNVSIAGSGFPVQGKVELYRWSNSTTEPAGEAMEWINSTTLDPNSMSLITVTPLAPLPPPPPPTAPSAPEGILVSAVGGNFVDVSYSQPAGVVTNDSSIIGSPSPTSPYCVPSSIESLGFAAASINITGLEPGSSYCFAVQAWNSAGASPLSAFVNATTQPSPVIPPPSGTGGGGGGGSTSNGTALGTGSPTGSVLGTILAGAVVTFLGAAVVVDVVFHRTGRKSRP